MTYFLLRDYDILPKTELPLSPWVAIVSYVGNNLGLHSSPLEFGAMPCWVLGGDLASMFIARGSGGSYVSYQDRLSGSVIPYSDPLKVDQGPFKAY